MNLDSYLDDIIGDTEALAAIAEAGDLTAGVAACPGWDLHRLLVHTGSVHRWATAALVEGRAPDAPIDPPDDEPLGAWLRDGAARLVARLRATDPHATTWHPFPAEQRPWVWGRRQAMETMVHRWDAERAIDATTTIAPARAADGLREYVELGLPRVLQRERLRAPDASLHLHCTDEGLADGTGEWVVWGDDGEYRVEAVHRKGDAALRGTAESLLLLMMGRVGRDAVDTVGDERAVDAWLSLPGW